MNVRQHSHQAISNILSAKMRSFLAVLGILVGTASVVALVTTGQLATQKALEQFKALGTDLLAVSLFQKSHSQQSTPANTLHMNEIMALEAIYPQIIKVAPYATLYKSIAFEGHKIKGVIVGADNNLEAVIKISMQEGGFVSFLDHYEKFCVIGQNIKKQLEKYTHDSLIGKQLWLGKNVFTIIGITNSWVENAFFNENINNAVIIPVRGANMISKDVKVSNMIMRLKADIDLDKLIEHIKTYVGQHAPDLNVFPRSAKQIIKSMESQGKIFTLLLGLIGGISLLVGGIGVMNVMLVSVTERRREIGIRMAIGARRRDIQTLFLIESIVLSLFGGVMGVIVGLIASFTIAYFSGWTFTFFSQPVLIGFAVSAATGVFFGFYPAYRASRLDPIETLRYD